MAIRIQLRRDTAANWTANNPLLYPGEVGIETDTLKFKIGPTTATAWNSITSYANTVPSDLSNTLNDYILAADLGNPDGPAKLDVDGNLIIPKSSIIFEGATADSYETILTVTDPTADRTLTLPNETGTIATQGYVDTAISSFEVLPSQTNNGGKYLTTNGSSTSWGTIDLTSYATLTTAQTLSNKTLSSPTINIGPGYIVGDTIESGLSFSTGGGLFNGHSNQIGGRLSLEVFTNWNPTTEISVGDTIFLYSAGNTEFNNIPWTVWVSGTNSGGYLALDAPMPYVYPTYQGLFSGLTVTEIKQANYISAVVSPTEISYLDGVTSGIQNQIDGKLSLSGGTMTGNLTLSGAPQSSLHAATKAYVDNITAGLNFHAAVHVATTADLSATYNNSAGTLSASGTFPQIDGETITETQRILVKSQSDPKQNGIYTLTDDGDPSGTWVLTRASDADNSPAGEIAYGDFVFVQTGSANAGYGYIMTTTGTITLGTSNINWTQFNAAQVVAAGNGLTEPSSGTLAIDTTITADLSTAQTFTNKTLTSPKINEDVAVTATATELNILDGATLSTTELNYVDGVTSSIQTQLDAKIAKSLVDAKGDILVGSADNTVTRLAAGTNGYLLTANSSATNGIEWAAAPVSLPSQTNNSGKFLTTDGSSASWTTLPTAILQQTIETNSATTLDTVSLSAFTGSEYFITIKQGSKTRSSKVIVQTDGTSVDMTEFAITETGGAISGVVISATTSSGNMLLQGTITDAATTIARVKLTRNINLIFTAVAPDAPTIGTATTTGSTTATVAFTAPYDNGGASITSYTATSSPGSITASGSSSPITVTGLSPSTNYTFTVTATNSGGTSSSSSSSNQITTDGPTYSLGDTGPGGGIIFYDAGSTQSWGRYLEAAPKNWSGANEDWGVGQATWSKSGNRYNYLNLPATIGTGASNTAAMLAQDSSAGLAAVRATSYNGGGKTDWFLPSRNELHEMMVYFGSSEFMPEGYWSSTDINVLEPGQGQAWFVGYLGSLTDFSIQKTYTLFVRPVRAI